MDKNLQELINLEKVTPKTMSIYRDIRNIRNKIVHGDKVFNDINEAISILKAV